MDPWNDEVDLDNSEHNSMFHQLPINTTPHYGDLNNDTVPRSLPHLQACTQTPHPNARATIPGPAGPMMAAMHRRADAVAAAGTSGAVPPLTQFFEKKAEDLDFKQIPWLAAMNFQGLSSPSSIQSIKAQKNTTERIPQVVGIVAACTPNGLGDLQITLKDTTGTIDASVHRRVREINLISVGCVLILQKVVAFRPSPRSCYLNVIADNVMKVFTKDATIAPTSSGRADGSSSSITASVSLPMGAALTWTDDQISQLQFDDADDVGSW